MNDYVVLYGVLVAIYLVDCVAWLPSAVRPFRARPRGAWSSPAELLSLRSGRWTAWLAGIVPGTGGLVKAEAQPLLMSPLGLCACSTGSRGVPIPFERLREARAEDDTLRLGTLIIARVATADFARATAGWLREVAAEQVERRASRIEARLEASLDVRAARKVVRRYRWCVAPLLWPVRMLAISMYVVLPIALYVRGLLGSWPTALIVVLLLIKVTWTFGARLRRMGRQVGGDVTTMCLAPPLAIRADDLAGRDLLAGLHALAVTRAACPEKVARAHAELALRSIRYPIPQEAQCCDAASWAREAWSRAIERWAGSQFGSAEVLLAPPAKESDRIRAYCPRCAQQFEREGGECPDCAGLELKSFT